jgi:hemolysin III
MGAIRRRRTYLFPNYSRMERLADNCIHGIGVVFSVSASVIILVSARHSPTTNIIALIIYSFGMMIMFFISAMYHISTNHTQKKFLRRLDRSAIYVMIAGSYTPFALIKIGDASGLALLIAVWTIAAIGVFLQIAFPRRLDGASIVLYLAQGWAILLDIDPLMSSISNFALWLLIAGGVIYTVGVVFHLSEQLAFHNAIWHGLVLIAASCHYASIYEAMIHFS